ncbi:MAG: DsbA family protein [Bryobacteraceae bacterium]
MLLGAAALWLAASQPLEGQAPSCTAQQLTAKQKQTLLDYVRKKYKLPSSILLSIEKDTPVDGTCFWELAFQGKSEIRTWELKLFASPDLRFLTDELMDTQRDPEDEERAKNQLLMRGLTQGASTVRGPENAPVTIAEFSDFQCPFCRKFAEILDEVLADGTQNVRVVFHHMPLASHNWARIAAEGAACAQLQSPQAFWRMHDEIFRNQASITPENIKEKLAGFAESTKEVDHAAFQQCMRDSMSLGLVLRDLNLGDANQVTGTPTLFINGHRVQGVENAARLRELIVEAGKEAGSPSAPAAKSAAAGTKPSQVSAPALTQQQEAAFCKSPKQ